MAKILVATDKPFAAIAVKGIREVVEGAGDELILLEKYGEKAKLLEAVKDVDAIIIRSDVIDAEVLDAAKQLKIVVRAGAGYDNVDLAAATAHNVCVMNTPGQNSNAVAELAFGMMVMAVRNFYNGTSGTELKGKKLGIHAYGNVGRNVARIAKGFGMEIYAFDAFCPASAIEADGVKPVASPEELYATCDIVSLHIPATAETKNSINYALVGKMPKGGLLVNTARIMRDGMPLKYQMCDTGAASSMWPMRSRRTLALVTSTPHLSQILPLKRTFLYLPQWHSQSLVGPKIRSQNRPSRSGLSVR